ncbi:MAG: DUF3780 domain-containing protein [Chloroflexaceae bacterium]|nr:DUF3780 domain-containing protein [Chloroflexaceae bacterium]
MSDFNWHGDAVHFVARRASNGDVAMYECNGTEKHRCTLLKPQWTAIAGAVTAEFNVRLQRRGVKAGRFGKETKLERTLGKELVVLAWAIEDADLALVRKAIQNWLGFDPSERWWLYTMTNAGGAYQADGGRGQGWRKALYHILCENPVGFNIVN